MHIIDGNGVLALNESGYVSSSGRILLEVHFGDAENIMIEVYLTSSIAHSKLHYRIFEAGPSVRLSRFQ